MEFGSSEPRDSGGELSVVVASFCGPEVVLRCVQSVRKAARDAEVIVATSDIQTAEAVSQRFPMVRVVVAPAASSVFFLRSAGASVAGGRLVALTEDHCTVSDDWARTLLAAHAGGAVAMGGPVENGATGRAYDWALFFAEYGFYLGPVAAGAASALTGINAAYDREVLMSCREAWSAEFRENEVHDVLRVRGVKLEMVPGAVVESHLPMRLGAAMGHLFGGGRHFAAYRRSKATRGGRVGWVLASPAVLGVLLVKLARRAWRRGWRTLAAFVWSLPFLVLLLGAWSAGEVVGYAVGENTFGGATRSERKLAAP